MKKKTRLERVQVKQLFDRFNYDIDLKNGHDVAILIAPNGCGKTTIFNLISFMLKPTLKSFSDIITTPFTECICTLSNRKKIKLSKCAASHYQESYTLEKLSKEIMEISGKGSLDIIKSVLQNSELELSIGRNKVYVIKNVLCKSKAWDLSLPFGDDDDEFMTIPFSDAELPFQDQDPDEAFSEINKLLTLCGCYMSVNYTRADRLHNKVIGNYIKTENPIEMAKINTQNIINELKEQYYNLQSKGKDQLPNIYLAADEKKPIMAEEEFIQRWTKYVSDIEKYRVLGLVDISDPLVNNKNLKSAYRQKGAFLSIYLDIYDKTLDPFAKEYDKMKLFVDILNERNRITGKKFKYGKEGIMLTVDDRELPLTCLSSGEKNDFIMFYNLIFNSNDNELILIDEPEISLHIEWQETFLDYLTQICEMNNLQAIVATHSPNIVNGHFELYAEKGLEYD
ncbi:MAG: AAA family ATPase [Lachnospiraceae bacterium]|nr:AAA family ATPase [Lachnospiraceae bacterium]